MMAVLKLIRLAGCFEPDEIYFGNIRRYQKMVNLMLSDVILMQNLGTSLRNSLKSNFDMALYSQALKK